MMWKKLWSGYERGGCCEQRRLKRTSTCGHEDRRKSDDRRSEVSVVLAKERIGCGTQVGSEEYGWQSFAA